MVNKKINFKIESLKMYEYFSIGEIADFFQISKSKLRYWEKEGLIKSARNIQNGYREYPLRIMADVANIIFYRSLNVSIEQLKTLTKMDIDALKGIMDSTAAGVDAQIEQLLQTKARIKTTRNHMDTIFELTEKPFTICRPKTKLVKRFSKLKGRAHLQSIIDDMYNIIAVIDISKDDLNDEEAFDIGIPALKHEDNEDIIWQRQDNAKYVKFLLRYDKQNPANSNFEEVHAYLKKHNYKPGKMIAHFLVREFGDKPVTYLEAYLELV